ncbi:hypothetical protein ACWATR_38390 [Nostoc sp. UIC 10890]
MSSNKPFHVYANQTQGQVEAGNPASLRDAARTLLVKNSVSGVEVKAVDEGKDSTASFTSAEKWSHEAIVAWSSVRPLRMQKLLRCGEFGRESGVWVFARVLG